MCDRCSSNDCCNSYLFDHDVIMTLCYDCHIIYDRQIVSVVVKKDTHYNDIFTGISYPHDDMKVEGEQKIESVCPPVVETKKMTTQEYVIDKEEVHHIGNTVWLQWNSNMKWKGVLTETVSSASEKQVRTYEGTILKRQPDGSWQNKTKGITVVRRVDV